MRHVLITAGTKGIGRRVAFQFLQEGYSVTVNYRSDDHAREALMEEWQDNSDRLQFIKGDVSKAEDIQTLFDETYSRFHRIDCLVHNAGPFVFERKKMTDYTDEEWLNLLHGNLSAVFRLTKLVLPVMRQQKFGRIITYGFQNAGDAPGWLHRGPFAAAKVGVLSLTRTIALEEAEYGITANMICPGIIQNDMKEVGIDYAEAHSQNRTPLGRSVSGEDIARAIVFLCQKESEMITGTALDLTGAVDVINRFRNNYDNQ
ncbi:3-oxoacyl-[acyl-carrier protein] reductase [Pullulanibacillus pueri]|uniref:Putative oxidoreductase YtkK n=1 Tax=Pullulanibacillus pueri TaxID=1437324 RepID=A0A8J3ENI9_9BACL|nr:SDR family oxidoreductase [Pullulanibacillus pueri]MBM7683497.1 3-oxoacyl-[acyl-carrier protein] reductase [Pullulanibacillus pueri]GGH86690.1 putative oxidoreductase YtkK [Pullulanibacillus pueri]